MSRTHEPISLTVTKTGTTYEAKDVPKEIKDATVLVRVTEDGAEIGTYEAHGWSEEGSIAYILPEDVGQQLEASQARTAAKAEKPEKKS